MEVVAGKVILWKDFSLLLHLIWKTWKIEVMNKSTTYIFVSVVQPLTEALTFSLISVGN